MIMVNCDCGQAWPLPGAWFLEGGAAKHFEEHGHYPGRITLECSECGATCATGYLVHPDAEAAAEICSDFVSNHSDCGHVETFMNVVIIQEPS